MPSKGLLKRISKLSHNEPQESPLPPELFQGPPVDVRTFVHDPRFLSLPPLGPRQIAILEQFFAPDAPYTECVMLYGKGSGKDFLAGIIISYMVYRTLLLENPQEHYGLAPGSSIDFLNVAQNAEQAERVFFEGSLKAKLANSRWFRQKGYKAFRHIIRFPKGIRAISAHSQNESFEGYNLLGYVMDEAAAFRSETKTANADKIYNTLRTSMVSRFGSLGRGCILSYPRQQGDFILKKYDEAANQPWVLRDRGATWEINPLRRREDFLVEFERDPIDAAAKYETFAPVVEDSFLSPELVAKCIGGTNYELSSLPEGPRYISSIDPAFYADRFALVCGHKEEPNVIVDSIRLWKPRKGIPVQMAPIELELGVFAKRTNSKIITDSHEIAVSVQKWQGLGVAVETVKVHTRAQQEQWTALKALIQAGQIRYPNEPELIRELTRLRVKRMGDLWKVEAAEGEFDDLADALARLAWALTTGRIERRGYSLIGRTR